MITPGFFRSKPCRDELARFLAREKSLGRSDLVLPVYYINSPTLNDEVKRAGDDLAQAIYEHQYADWRELRFEPFTAPEMRRQIAKLATQIGEAIARFAPPTPTIRTLGDAGAPPRAAAAQVQEASAGQTAPSGRPVAEKTEPPVHVVDALHRGQFTTIGEAIRAARAGDRILVKPGLYSEALVIDKPLELLGDGRPGEVVVQAKDAHVILFRTTMGRIVNLSLRQLGGAFYAVDSAQGRLVLEDCDITSQGLSSVGIHDGADPLLRRNRIHDGQSGGVFVYEGGLGTIEDNDIFGNANTGVSISEQGNPTVRNNRIHDDKTSGVLVFTGGLGTIEDNDIFGNALSGVEIREQGNPTVRKNRIHDGKSAGVHVYTEGLGTIEDNDIFGNASAGVSIKEQGNPTVRNNRINKNEYEAVWIYDGGQGTFENNDLTGNKRGAWDIEKDCLPNVKRSGNKE